MSTDPMSEEQKRIRIAEACGWKEVMPEGKSASGIHPDPTAYRRVFVPDYLNDLNACHEMEKTLPFDVLNGTYKTALLDITFANPKRIAGMFHTTARQRADAFLAVLGPAPQP